MKRQAVFGGMLVFFGSSGNVSHSSYTGAPADGSAWVDNPRGTFQVMRGGGWTNSIYEDDLRALVRGSVGPEFGNGRQFSFGFRCSQ